MTDTKGDIYLATYTDAAGKETERLIRAEKRSAAQNHVLHLCKANAQNVADVLGAGGKIEEAA